MARSHDPLEDLKSQDTFDLGLKPEVCSLAPEPKIRDSNLAISKL